MRRHDWRYRCPACWFSNDSDVKSFKDEIEIPQHVYQPLIDERMGRWEGRA